MRQTTDGDTPARTAGRIDGAVGPGGSPTDGGVGIDLASLDQRLAEIRTAQHRRRLDEPGRGGGWGGMLLAHHWPEHYHERCIRVGSRWLCRRCTALYPLALTVALASAAGFAPWPAGLDPWMIWALSLPPTLAYVGDALGWFPYRARWQVAATLLAALAFGRALGYELVERWQPVFWGPIAVFGGVWFAATVVGLRRRSRPHNAASASSISSAVL